jgi:hypothetical protein
MDAAIVKAESSVDINVRSRHLEVETLRRNNAVAYLRPAIQERKNLRSSG